jgi:hypothetical protein
LRSQRGDPESTATKLSLTADAFEIAREWNVKASDRGFVAVFEVRTDYLARYRVKKRRG